MESQLSTETWTQIFNYLESRADLHSCLLVNRLWCRIMVKILWEHPFSYNMSHEKFKSILKTYLTCLNERSIERLEESGIKLIMFNNKKPMFAYNEFLRDLVIDSIRFDICIYNLINESKEEQKIKKINKKRRNFQEKSEDLKDIRKIQQKYSKEGDLILEELIKLICSKSNKIRSLSVSPCNMMDYMITLLKDENNYYFNNIKSFTINSTSKVYNSYEPIKVYELIFALSRVSKNITHIRVNNACQSYQSELGDSLGILLNSQTNLRSLDLEYLTEPVYYEPIISKSNIISTLSDISFKNINFGNISQKSMNSLIKLSQNLKILKVASCLNCSLLCDAMKQCSNLVEFTYETCQFGEDLDFLLTILKSSSSSLRYLDIFWIRDGSNDNESLLKRLKLINCISEHCTKLTYLKLRRLNSEDLFSIWYGCKQLEVLSFFCNEHSDWDDSLEDLGRLLPCTLKVLKIGHWIEMPFSAMALESFLKGCKESLKKLEIYSFKKLCKHSEYVSVLKNSGVYYELIS
ncbi:hypothetical protein RhiirA1_503661 [Rhizophagus irregularis]|uniref:F-box domain-containing protein n=2 Tax=Rhizophagus irregularis TaxID=588596 RepID=A0A2N0S2H1_9GLOM|nr:hypothetical protein RhiirA1_503661 [Rhizophagus irregularis]